MNRRKFLQGSLLGISAMAMTSPLSVFAQSKQQKALKAIHRTIEVNGKAAKVFGLVDDAGKHGLVFEQGQSFDVLFKNELSEPTIIHWHGLTPPWESDGVADAPLPMVAPGADRSFDFAIHNTGTHWMHAHTLQEQNLLAAPLIVRSKEDMKRDEQEVVILLHDFSFTPAEELLANLRKGSGHTMSHGTGHDMGGHNMPMKHDMGGHQGHGAPAAQHDGAASGHDMMTMDINDIEYDAYLANDRTLDDPEVVQVEDGGRVRLRIINGASGTGFTVDLGELTGQLIAVDGEELVNEISGTRFPLAMGQRADIRVQLPKGKKAFPILALREGAVQRTGIFLQPTGAAISKLVTDADVAGPVLDMMLEEQLRGKRALSEKDVTKHFEIDLNGTMDGYTWTMDMKEPVIVQMGDRVEITMRNPSMMAHPMHLHGHHFQVVAIDGKRISGARRDTVNISPNRSVTIAVDADNPGTWAFHCHHLYHMVTGMMDAFSYRKA